MADYPNFTTTPVIQNVTGTGWTIDVASLSLDLDLSVIDFSVYQTFNGNRIPQNELQKTSSTTITYVGAALPADTEVVAMRSTPLSRYQFIDYATQFRSVVYNSEIDNIYTLLAEYTQLSKFLLENFIKHPVPFVDGDGNLTWDLDGDGLPDPEIAPVNIKGDTGAAVRAMGIIPSTADLPTASTANWGHFYITSDDGHGWINDGEIPQWVDMGQIRGQSTYELWLLDGNTGTISDFLTDVKGEQGTGLNLDGTVATEADLPTSPIVPINQIFITQDTKKFYLSNGDGTWTDLGVLYTPIPIWESSTSLAWDLTGDGIADTAPVNLQGPGVPLGGSTGQILRKQSALDFVTEWANPAIYVPKRKVLTSGDTTWTKPANYLQDSLKYVIVGPGGGGGGGYWWDSRYYGGGGGGAGEVKEGIFTGVLPASITGVFGNGGIAGTVPQPGGATTGVFAGGNGQDGETTSFNSIVADGGQGGWNLGAGGLGGSSNLVKSLGHGHNASFTGFTSRALGGTGGGPGGGHVQEYTANTFTLFDPRPDSGCGGVGLSGLLVLSTWSFVGPNNGASGYVELEWLELV